MAVGVQCRDVGKRFGAACVLNGVSWTARAGAVSGLVGVSAAGKTSLLRIIAGFGHRGWDGHPWEAERAWVDSLTAQGKLRRLDFPESVAAMPASPNAGRNLHG